MNEALQLTLFAEDFPAKTSPLRERVQELKANAAGYGRNTPELLASYDPSSSSWRTSQHCLVEGLTVFSETWPRSGTMQNGIAYQLQPLAYPTHGIGYGLLPTPNATDGYAWTKVSKTKVRRSIYRAVSRGGQIRFNYFPQWANFSMTQAATLSETMMGFPMGWTDLNSSETP